MIVIGTTEEGRRLAVLEDDELVISKDAIVTHTFEIEAEINVSDLDFGQDEKPVIVNKPKKRGRPKKKGVPAEDLAMKLPPKKKRNTSIKTRAEYAIEVLKEHPEGLETKVLFNKMVAAGCSITNFRAMSNLLSSTHDIENISYGVWNLKTNKGKVPSTTKKASPTRDMIIEILRTSDDDSMKMQDIVDCAKELSPGKSYHSIKDCLVHSPKYFERVGRGLYAITGTKKKPKAEPETQTEAKYDPSCSRHEICKHDECLSTDCVSYATS